ncbi:MAG: hypothetical protein AAB821_00570 [Patescibacteria group bacterium]
MDPISAGTAILAANKLLGKTAETISEDLAKLYASGRDKIIEVALRKTDTEKMGQVNLRVARDVFWNGSYTDESICAEYFGGILASSRSEDGKDDMGVFYVDIIKSLSSNQLMAHYILYRTLNKFLLGKSNKKNLNLGKETDLQELEVFVTQKIGITDQPGSKDLGAILHGLNSKKLIGNFESNIYKLENNMYMPYIKFIPTALGIQLFAIANNSFSVWRKFSTFDFGDFPDVVLPQLYGNSIDSMLDQSGLKSESTPNL